VFADGRGRGGHRARARGSFGRGFSQRFGGITVGTEPTQNTTQGSANKTKCYYCGKTGHWKKDCYKRKADEPRGSEKSKEFTFLADIPSNLPGMGGILDSGVSQHISNDREQFGAYSTVRKGESITIADGTKLQASGIGDIEIPTKAGTITLTGVWHVPTIGAILICVARMVDAGYKVEFERTTCFVSKMGMKTMLG